MKLSEAIKLMEAGKKVKYKDWVNDYIHIMDGYIVNDVGDNYNMPYHLLNGWEEYIETVKLSDLKVGDKWCYKGGSIQFLILPKEMGKYCRKGHDDYVICQDLSSSQVDICYGSKNDLVVQIKD